MKNNSILQKITGILVGIIFYLGIVATISVPFWGPIFYNLVEIEQGLHMFMTIMLIFSGGCAVLILYNLKRIFITIKSDPFVKENIRHLHTMGITCVVIFAVYVLKLFILPTFATVIIILVFGMAGLFCLTIKQLFEKAVEYKEDNDMTI